MPHHTWSESGKHAARDRGFLDQASADKDEAEGTLDRERLLSFMGLCSRKGRFDASLENAMWWPLPRQVAISSGTGSSYLSSCHKDVTATPELSLRKTSKIESEEEILPPLTQTGENCSSFLTARSQWDRQTASVRDLPFLSSGAGTPVRQHASTPRAADAEVNRF